MVNLLQSTHFGYLLFWLQTCFILFVLVFYFIFATEPHINLTSERGNGDNILGFKKLPQRLRQLVRTNPVREQSQEYLRKQPFKIPGHQIVSSVSFYGLSSEFDCRVLFLGSCNRGETEKECFKYFNIQFKYLNLKIFKFKGKWYYVILKQNQICNLHETVTDNVLQGLITRTGRSSSFQS